MKWFVDIEGLKASCCAGLDLLVPTRASVWTPEAAFIAWDFRFHVYYTMRLIFHEITALQWATMTKLSRKNVVSHVDKFVIFSQLRIPSRVRVRLTLSQYYVKMPTVHPVIVYMPSHVPCVKQSMWAKLKPFV